MASVKYTYKVYSIQMNTESMISEEEYSQIVNTFMLAVQKAGEEILSIYNDNQFDIQLKDDNSPLTQAGTASGQAIVEGVCGTVVNFKNNDKIN